MTSSLLTTNFHTIVYPWGPPRDLFGNYAGPKAAPAVLRHCDWNSGLLLALLPLGRRVPLMQQNCPLRMWVKIPSSMDVIWSDCHSWLILIYLSFEISINPGIQGRFSCCPFSYAASTSQAFLEVLCACSNSSDIMAPNDGDPFYWVFSSHQHLSDRTEVGVIPYGAGTFNAYNPQNMEWWSK